MSMTRCHCIEVIKVNVLTIFLTHNNHRRDPNSNMCRCCLFHETNLQWVLMQHLPSVVPPSVLRHPKIHLRKYTPGIGQEGLKGSRSGPT